MDRHTGVYSYTRAQVKVRRTLWISTKNKGLKSSADVCFSAATFTGSTFDNSSDLKRWFKCTKKSWDKCFIKQVMKNISIKRRVRGYAMAHDHWRHIYGTTKTWISLQNWWENWSGGCWEAYSSIRGAAGISGEQWSCTKWAVVARHEPSNPEYVLQPCTPGY